MIIREETPVDIEAIHNVTVVAFENHPISHQTEQFIVKALRTVGVMSISLVAEEGGQIVGHAAFSPVTISDGSYGWFGLGPVSVLPQLQRKGIGTALIEKGLAMLKEKAAAGCALVGDPNYYQRFGFRNYPQMVHEGIPQQVFLVLPFSDQFPNGNVVFHEGFMAES